MSGKDTVPTIWDLLEETAEVITKLTRNQSEMLDALQLVASKLDVLEIEIAALQTPKLLKKEEKWS